MEKKICKKCGVEKLLCEFVKDKTKKNGTRNVCKICNNITNKESSKKYRENNPEKLKETQLKYRGKNREVMAERTRKYRENNPEKVKEQQKDYYWKNKEQRLENRNKWFQNNKDRVNKTYMTWLNNNRDNVNKVRRENHYKRYQTDILYKLKINIRNRVKLFLQSKNFNIDVNRTYDIVGCSPEELRNYIELKFVNEMSWENYGDWHIDHITPISFANNEGDVYKLSHYTNLQPLWKEDNLKKGNKLI
jgi:hypothetical protein